MARHITDLADSGRIECFDSRKRENRSRLCFSVVCSLKKLTNNCIGFQRRKYNNSPRTRASESRPSSHPPPFSSSAFNAARQQDLYLLATSFKSENHSSDKKETVVKDETHRRTIFRFRGAVNRDFRGLVVQRKAEVEIKHVPGSYASPSVRLRNGRFLRRLDSQGVYIGILDDSGGVDALAGQASIVTKKTILIAPVSVDNVNVAGFAAASNRHPQTLNWP
ncbi:hypothetical protein BDZ89DRAFT_1121125 [Hymenopellis radicata]|nr:hypothetical protein BDZ89DRAFT_1121125 [Hymenopellis radicata]